MNNNTAIVACASVIVIVFGIGMTVSSLAPDATAQRIEACMTQPNMEYNHSQGCTKVGD